ncbi:hypothetical protein GCM10020358_14330 [Amorphoplanes nipponensis]
MRGFLDRTPEHARVVTGGRRIGERGWFVAPTVVAGLRQRDEMIQDEIFGPVITVQSFDDETPPSGGPTTCGSASARASGPATTAGRCGCHAG